MRTIRARALRGLLARLAVVMAAWLCAATAHGQARGFTIEQALSAPFTSDLSAAPARGRLAWEANLNGRRNLWIAEPAANGKVYLSRQITHYAEDDGQEIDSLHWTPDAETIVYVRGDSVQGESHPVPNPAWFPKGAQQQIWAASVEAGEPRLLAEGHSPAVSPDGKMVAYVLKGQLWGVRLEDAKAKPEQLLQTRGSVDGLRWSPDGLRLAFVSDRGEHSFIAVYAAVSGAVTYLDPSTDGDSSPVWSPDSARIAFLRVPPDKETDLFGPHRRSFPWSIRVVEAATGKGHEVWRAAEGMGSAYRETASEDQLHWAAGDRIVFPWEHDGWLHLYAVSAQAGAASAPTGTPTAVALPPTAAALTPGEFEVEHVSLSADRKTLVFDSNQSDIDRRHVWRIAFAADRSNHAAEQVTSGAGIETRPVVASDGVVAMLRSDARVPMRAAVMKEGRLADLAPQAIPADFPSAQFVEPRQVIFPAADGMAIHGQLFVPVGTAAGEQRPALVFFHGGSQRQMLLGWHYMEYYSNAYAMNQYLVSLGYVVLSVNYRSGTGYGLDFREALNYGGAGASEFNDALGAGLYLKSLAYVDGARIGCWGGSYGGYLTALALARASDLFAAGVDMHGVHDWSALRSWTRPNWDPQQLQQMARVAFASSPIASVETWRSPVLLIQGDDDRNVPFLQMEELTEALRRQKVEFEQLVFPDEIHDFLLRRDWVRAYSLSAEFLGRKLGEAKKLTH
jgi:dipeptidyl aminopeptidase/acylaminoacyl peptidase